MLETLATWTLWTKFIIPLGFFALVFLACVCIGTVRAVRWNKKIRLLERKGFSKYLHSVSSVGGRSWYGWTKGTVRIHENQINRLSYKELKQRIERENGG